MPEPLLTLSHDWHRQRAQLRAGRMRPPPLVAAGLDLGRSAEGRQVTLGGLAVIFGVFPASLEEFVELARSRLHLGSGQARELDAVLNTRILAMWAWLPTLKQDCYLEMDRATGAEQVWLVGPGAGESRMLDADEGDEAIDSAFLDALVLNGPGHWGGESGLVKLVERFGRQPLLVAAQIADLLDHQPKDPRRALEQARARWPALQADDEAPWAPLADSEHPWVAVQLGRLALRLGLMRAARLLLRQGGQTDVAPVAHFDLGQACEALDDLATAEAAFARYASARPSDPDAWRRLLLCRLRLGHFTVAEETLKRYRASGGKDRDIIERMLIVVARAGLPAGERAWLVAWLAARLPEALPRRMSIDQLVDTAADRLPGDQARQALRLAALVDQLRIELRERLPAEVVSGQVDDLALVVLLSLPLLVRRRRPAGERDLDTSAAQAGAAAALWAMLRWGQDHALSDLGAGMAVRDLVRFAHGVE
jgi:tetratricopeptide (TPR) repeat protein